MILRVLFIVYFLAAAHDCCQGSSRDLASLNRDEVIGDLRVANLYTDSRGQIVGAKFLDIRSGAPIYLIQIDTVPQAFMWVDTPADSNAGLAHSLEHLLGGKGTKGRYVSLLTGMRLSRSAAATTDDFNFYSFSSGTGMDGFFEQFHAWLDALFMPDFSDLEAEREFYHLGTSFEPATKRKTLVEKGSVYDEMQTGQGIYSYYFELNKRALGEANPFGFYNSGVPDEMRHVVPADIRRFYREHYRIGPTTGFIFALNREENVFRFLDRISHELSQFAGQGIRQQVPDPVAKPKYPVQPSPSTEVGLFPFPSSSEADRGEVRFGWKPIKTDSRADLKLLQLFFRALADGDKSLLYKSFIDSRTRSLNSGATNVESLVFLENSPYFPAEFIGFSGIPGNLMTTERIEKLRSRINLAIHEVSQYPDNSETLAAFNKLVGAYAKAWRRSQSIWIKTAPRFGLNYETEWKEYLEYLEMDRSFIRSISDEGVWREVEKRIQSGKNIWRDLIDQFHLLDVPYATASVPSPRLQEEMDKDRDKRVAAKVKQLMAQYETDDLQALDRFEQEEITKTKEIDKISALVRRPTFTDHPPLTPDDNIQYSQFHLESVPVIATFFDSAPTIDLGLSFDLRRIPRKYYKYLPILPRCLDSLGLKTKGKVISYADLQAQTQTEINDFAVRYDFNPVSRVGDLRIQVSAITPAEFRRALALVQQMATDNYLDLSNADRLRDVVDKRLWQDDAYKGENDYWFMNPSHAFRYQDDSLYLALSSFFTRAHWDDRLKWLLHRTVRQEEIASLASFAEEILSSSSGMSGRELSQALSKSDAKGLQRELLEYWQRNIPAFPQDELLAGLRRLTLEVQEDLKTGPDKTIAELRDLQRIVLNRWAVSVDLTLDRANLGEIRPALARFLQSIPDVPYAEQSTSEAIFEKAPLMENVRKRYRSYRIDFPWYVGLDDPRDTTASMVFYADFPGYSQLDHKSLLQVLSSKLVSGSGPHTLYTKIEEDGLAYGSSISSDPSLRLLQYYAGRSPDIPSLIKLVNAIAAKIPQLQDESLVDYALQKTFPIPRSMSTFTERGRGIARDIRNGNDPAQMRRFSQAILKLRTEPNLLSELNQELMDSIGPVLINKDFTPQQRDARSLFFFVGPERLLADAENRLHISQLLRLYPEDFWLDF